MNLKQKLKSVGMWPPVTNSVEAEKRVESAELMMMNILHEFGYEWIDGRNEPPLERRAIKRMYARRLFDVVFNYIENETRLTTKEIEPPSETGDKSPTKDI